MANSSYLKVFPEIFQERQEGLQKIIDKLKANSVKPNFVDSYVDLLASDYRCIGIGEWLLHADPVAAKKNFYLAAKIQEFLFQKYDDKSLLISPSFVVMSSYLKVLMAIISDSRKLINSLAILIGNRLKEEKEEGHPFADNVGYALKYLLLNDDEKAKSHIDALLNMEHNKNLKLRIGYGRVLKGILAADEKTVDEGLKVMIDGYKKDADYKGSPEEFFSIPVLAFAKLAIRRGIKVYINDPIAPKELLTTHEIEYPVIDYIK